MKNFNVSVKNVLEVVKDPVDEVHEMFYVSINDISKIEIKWINIRQWLFCRQFTLRDYFAVSCL